jgi:hypothetical protein
MKHGTSGSSCSAQHVYHMNAKNIKHALWQIASFSA